MSPPAAQQAAASALPAEGDSGQQGSQQGGTGVQAVVLEPIEVTWRQPKVASAAVPHNELNPEDGSVQRCHRPVAVQRGQTLHAGLIAEDDGKKVQTNNTLISSFHPKQRTYEI